MLNLLRPDFQFESIHEIPIKTLQELGISGLLIDLDNTVAPWNECTLTQEVIDWFQKIKTAGIKACIISNNRRPERVSTVAGLLGILFISRAAKPRRKAFQMGIEALNLKAEKIAVIGDQIFTDIFGGNRIGLKTILVSPICKKEFTGTKVLRFLERIVGRKARFKASATYLKK